MELRAYCFANMYMGGIHAGIQSAHALAEMSVLYSPDSMYHEWVKHHKTLIIKNGGDSDRLHHHVLETVRTHGESLDLPWAEFYEPGLNSALTAVAVIVPRCVWEFQDNRPRVMLPTNPPQYVTQGDLSAREQDFLAVADLIRACPLAK